MKNFISLGVLAATFLVGVSADALQPPMFFNIFGEDNRVEADYTAKPFSRIVRLSNGCTGSLVWKNLVLTAAHCLPGISTITPANAIVEVYTHYHRGQFKAKAQILQQVVGSYNPQEELAGDWAILVIDQDLGTEEGYFGYNSGVGLTKDDLRDVTLAGYSTDLEKGQILTVHSGCEIRRQLNRAKQFHDCDSTRGVSGAPLFKCNDQSCYLVGMSVAEHRNGSETSLHLERYQTGGENVSLNPRLFSKAITELRERFTPEKDLKRLKPSNFY